MICPNKNLPEWKALEKAQPNLAYYLWNKYEGRVPSNFFTSDQDILFGTDTSNIEFTPDTINAALTFLDTVGVKINFTNFSKEDVLAAANFLDQTVEIVEDLEKRKKAWDKLPEEAAHWWYRLLKNSNLKNDLWKLALESDRLQELIESNYGNYREENGTIPSSVLDVFTEETIGQLIAESIKRIEENKSKPVDKRFWSRFITFIKKLLGKYKEYQTTPFDIAAEKILNSDLSDLMSLEEYQQLYSDYYGETLTFQDSAEVEKNTPSVLSEIDYEKTFKSLMARLKKRVRKPTDKTVDRIKAILTKDSKLTTEKLTPEQKLYYNIEDVTPSLLSFEKFTERYKRGIPKKDNLVLDGAKAFDLAVYKAVRDLILSDPTVEVPGNLIPYEDFIHYLDGFLGKNYLLNFQIMQGFENYRIAQTFLDDTAQHRKVGLRFNDEYFTNRSHFTLSPLAWGNITYFKSNPNLSEPDSVLIHEIQNDFWERIDKSGEGNLGSSIESLLNLPVLFRNLADNNPSLAFSQFKSKIQENKNLFISDTKAADGLKVNSPNLEKVLLQDVNRVINNARSLIKDAERIIKYGYKISDHTAEALYNALEDNVVRDSDESGSYSVRSVSYRVGASISSAVPENASEEYRNILTSFPEGLHFKKKPKSAAQLKVLIIKKLQKQAEKNIVIWKGNILAQYKFKNKIAATFSYDNLSFEKFSELYNNVQYNKSFLLEDVSAQINSENSSKQELWTKYFNPLVHHLLQTVIKEKGKDFNIYFPSHEIVMLSQQQVPNQKSQTPTADLYAGEEDVKQGIVSETGVMYRNMKKLNGIKLEFVPDIPGFVKPVYGYKINVSNYKYQTPILFGVDLAKKENIPSGMTTTNTDAETVECIS